MIFAIRRLVSLAALAAGLGFASACLGADINSTNDVGGARG